MTNPEAIEGMFLDHLRAIFKCNEGTSVANQERFDYRDRDDQGREGFPSLLGTIKTKLTEEQRIALDRPVTTEEIRAALFQMDGGKAPGLDGFVAAFYQKNWGWLEKDIVDSVQSFFHSGRMLKELNHTFITLIRKNPNPQGVGDFRPISLCNVLYKLVTKILVNWLREVMGDLISQFQNGFVPSRSIYNILIAHISGKGRRGRSRVMLSSWI